jgi:hypothetical protein
MNAPHRRLRATRNRVILSAMLTRHGGGMQDVALEDLSIDGCCVRGYFNVGERVELCLPRMGCFVADVRWARRGFAGLRFDRGARG